MMVNTATSVGEAKARWGHGPIVFTNFDSLSSGTWVQRPPNRRSSLSSAVTADRIRELLDRDPFVPFRIRSSSGDSYTVTNPHLVALMRAEAFVADRTDRWTLLPYLHIAAVEVLQNGHGKRSGRKRPRR
jgi:hypothetical protein